MANKARSVFDIIGATRGSKVLTAGAHTGLEFKSFRASIDDTTISVLKSKTDLADATSDDVLSGHITGGAATGLKTNELIVCQQDIFTDITVDSGGQIVIYF